jgi:hypothetical protein
MSAPVAAILEAARQVCGLTNDELWIGYYSLGGTADPQTLGAYLAGTAIPSRGQYDVIAQALNDHFVDGGGNHPVPYDEDLTD